MTPVGESPTPRSAAPGSAAQAPLSALAERMLRLGAQGTASVMAGQFSPDEAAVWLGLVAEPLWTGKAPADLGALARELLARPRETRRLVSSYETACSLLGTLQACSEPALGALMLAMNAQAQPEVHSGRQAPEHADPLAALHAALGALSTRIHAACSKTSSWGAEERNAAWGLTATLALGLSSTDMRAYGAALTVNLLEHSALPGRPEVRRAGLMQTLRAGRSLDEEGVLYAALLSAEGKSGQV